MGAFSTDRQYAAAASLHHMAEAGRRLSGERDVTMAFSTDQDWASWPGIVTKTEYGERHMDELLESTLDQYPLTDHDSFLP